jgi:hypothetical protein
MFIFLELPKFREQNKQIFKDDLSLNYFTYQILENNQKKRLPQPCGPDVLAEFLDNLPFCMK